MGRNANRDKAKARDDSQAWRRLMTVAHKKQPAPKTPLRPSGTRNCARCGGAFVNVYPEASLAACFCPDCQDMVPEGWED